jgi:hypothetical protein
MRREEGEKISLRFPQTFEAASLFRPILTTTISPGWLVSVRKPLDGAYAPFTAGAAMRPAAGLFFYAQKIGLFAHYNEWRILG